MQCEICGLDDDIHSKRAHDLYDRVVKLEEGLTLLAQGLPNAVEETIKRKIGVHETEYHLGEQ